jgi:hypothetical protein
MKNLELLVKGQEYTVKTQFNEYDRLVFSGFSVENDDVTLACFDDCRNGIEAFFDISVSTNEVKVM